MEKRLYRPSHDRVLAGVCSGIAEYFALDPALVRLGWALATVLGFAGILAYLIAWGVLPDEDGQRAALPWVLAVLLVGLPLACGLCFACWAMFMAVVAGN